MNPFFVLILFIFGLPVWAGKAFAEDQGTFSGGLGELMQKALDESDEIRIIGEKKRQLLATEKEVFGNYLPQVEATYKVGRSAAYPSSARTLADPLGASEYTNATAVKISVDQTLFDGFKTSSEIKRQQALMKALDSRKQIVGKELLKNVIESYLTAWRHNQAMLANIDMVSNLMELQRRVTMQTELGAENQTVKSYVDARLTAARQVLLETRNAYRDALHQLSFYTRTELLPETFTFEPLRIPVLKDSRYYETHAAEKSPELTEEMANRDAAGMDLRKSYAEAFPTLTLNTDVEESNDLGGSTSANRNGTAMLQMHYKLFDGFSSMYKRARIRSEVTEKELNIARLRRRQQEDVAQLWRQAKANEQEHRMAQEQAEASRKVRDLRAQDTESGSGDIVRLIEAEETFLASRINLLDLARNMAQKHFFLAMESGLLSDPTCLISHCEDLPMEPISEMPETSLVISTTTAGVTEEVKVTAATSATTNIPTTTSGL